MALGKFSKPGTASKATKPATKAAAKPPAKKKSRFAGVEAAGDRPPIPQVGTYRLRLTALSEGFNPGNGCNSAKFTFEIVALDERAQENHAEGGTVFIPERTSGNGSAAGMARTKTAIMALAGFEDEAAYNEFDPDAYFIDACLGEDNEFSAEGQPLIGRLADVEVTRGKAKQDGGDYFRNYRWSVVADDEQDVPSMAA